jgi:small subunit ribosomal protein S17
MADDTPTENNDETLEAAAPAGSAPATPPEPSLEPKERRRRARASKAARSAARPQLTPEERHEERAAQRRRKAGERRVGRQRERAKQRAASSGPTADIAAREHEPGAQKTRQGVVVSDRADKTITVRIDIARRHRRYEKIVRTSNTLHAHDERNDAHIGDTVIVREARPLSRTKRWRLVQVVERAK